MNHRDASLRDGRSLIEIPRSNNKKRSIAAQEYLCPVMAVLCMGLFFLAGLCLGCKETPSVPPTEKPGKRDYVWVVDTINYPGSFQTTMRDIWGSAPNNVYVVGHNERGFGKMFRYDGNGWAPVRLTQGEGGLIAGPIDLSAIYGFSANDVYAAGQRFGINPNPPPNFLDSSLIIHFDGSRWSEVPLPARGRQLIGLGKGSGTSIWAGGVNGVSYSNQGNAWRTVYSDTTYWFLDFEFNDQDAFALAYLPVPGVTVRQFFFRWSDPAWVIVDSFSLAAGLPARFGEYALSNIGGALYSAGQGVFRKDGSMWTKLMDSYPHSTLLAIFGTRSQHVFSVGTGAAVFHFNGTDWHRYAQFARPDVYCSGVWCTDDEVFVVATDGERTFIYHGK
jgi:hypothetical protein